MNIVQFLKLLKINLHKYNKGRKSSNEQNNSIEKTIIKFNNRLKETHWRSKIKLTIDEIDYDIMT